MRDAREMSPVPEQEAYRPQRKRDQFDDLFAPVGYGVNVMAGEAEPGDGYDTQVKDAGEEVVCYKAAGEVDEGFKFWGGEDVDCLFKGHGWKEES